MFSLNQYLWLLCTSHEWLLNTDNKNLLSHFYVNKNVVFITFFFYEKIQHLLNIRGLNTLSLKLGQLREPNCSLHVSFCCWEAAALETGVLLHSSYESGWEMWTLDIALLLDGDALCSDLYVPLKSSSKSPRLFSFLVLSHCDGKGLDTMFET